MLDVWGFSDGTKLMEEGFNFDATQFNVTPGGYGYINKLYIDGVNLTNSNTGWKFGVDSETLPRFQILGDPDYDFQFFNSNSGGGGSTQTFGIYATGNPTTGTTFNPAFSTSAMWVSDGSESLTGKYLEIYLPDTGNFYLIPLWQA